LPKNRQANLAFSYQKHNLARNGPCPSKEIKTSTQFLKIEGKGRKKMSMSVERNKNINASFTTSIKKKGMDVRFKHARVAVQVSRET